MNTDDTDKKKQMEITRTKMGLTIPFQPIGIIHSPYTSLEDMPIQPAGAEGVQGMVEIFPEFVEGLTDLEGFSHIYLLYHLHRSEGFKLTVIPFMDTQPHGVFATRAPRRPNPIGLSVVRLVRREHHILYIENVDMLDGTPLLDIKPYVPEFDDHPAERFGWLEGVKGKIKPTRSDDRFI